MKVYLILAFALLLTCTGAGVARAQGTPDWLTPHQETVCDSETGAAFGLCNAYCEAMDCDSANAQASATACTKVKNKFTQITGKAFLPCESCPPPPAGTTCPCVGAFTLFNNVLNSTSLYCQDLGQFILAATPSIPDVYIAATCSLNPPLGGGCAVGYPGSPDILNITSAEGAACMQLMRQACTPVP